MPKTAIPVIDLRLQTMQDELITLLRTHLGDNDNHPLIARLTEQTPNVESLVADLSNEMDLTVYQRELSQLNDIAAARKRIRDGVFGKCLECDTAIDSNRLNAYPTAKRCLNCQAMHEKNLPRRGVGGFGSVATG